MWRDNRYLSILLRQATYGNLSFMLQQLLLYSPEIVETLEGTCREELRLPLNHSDANKRLVTDARPIFHTLTPPHCRLHLSDQSHRAIFVLQRSVSHAVASTVDIALSNITFGRCTACRWVSEWVWSSKGMCAPEEIRHRVVHYALVIGLLDYIATLDLR